MAKRKVKSDPKTVDKGASNIAAQFNPGAGLQVSATTTPEGAISVAAMQARFSSLQPVQAYQMSIAARAAISAIANQISRCPIRIFDRKSGDEIVGGELFEIFRRPSPGWSQHQFVEECISWYNIENEMSVMIPVNKLGRPLGLLPICPTRLWVLEPSVVNELKEIKKWMYLWPSGMSPFAGMGTAQPTVAPAFNNDQSQMVINAEHLIFYKGFNPSSHIRGCSPLITGVNELSTTYYAARYNKELFVNGNFPNVLINVPKAMSEKQRKDLEQRFAEEFSLANGSSHKTLFVSGTETEVQVIGNGQSKEGDFLAMQRFYMEQIFMLYRVPSIEAGFADKTRYETADQERAIFLEQTILPQMDMFSEVLQHQFVNPYFTFDDNKKKIKRGEGKSIGKLMEKSLDYSFDQRTESDIVVLLDPDQLPIMSEIRKGQWKAIQQMCDTLHVSINEAAADLGFEIPYSPVRDQIYIPAGFQKIADSPEDTAEDIAKAALAQTEAAQGIQTSTVEADEVDTESKKDMQKKLHGLIHSLRSKYLNNLQNGTIPTLAELDADADKVGLKNTTLKKELRIDCHKLRGIIKETADPVERIAKAKEYLNTKNSKYEKSLVGRMI